MKNVSFLPTTLPVFAHAPDVPVFVVPAAISRDDVEPRNSTTVALETAWPPCESLPAAA